MPVEVDLGMGGAGGAERGVQFENVVNAQKIFWEAPLGKSGGSRVGMVPVPLLVVLSADSLLGLAKAASKGSGGAVAGARACVVRADSASSSLVASPHSASTAEI